MTNLIYRYTRETKGAIAILFAVMLPILVSFIGLGIDYSLAMLEKQRLQNALDNAALAAITSGITDEGALKTMVVNFINANYGKEVDPNNVTIDMQDGIVNISVTGAVRVSFLERALGSDEIEISARTGTANERVERLEIVLLSDANNFYNKNPILNSF